MLSDGKMSETKMLGKFIILTDENGRHCINTSWIEEVAEMADGSCIVYLAYTVPDGIDQDYIEPKESFIHVTAELGVYVD